MAGEPQASHAASLHEEGANPPHQGMNPSLLYTSVILNNPLIKQLLSCLKFPATIKNINNNCIVLKMYQLQDRSM